MTSLPNPSKPTNKEIPDSTGVSHTATPWYVGDEGVSGGWAGIYSEDLDTVIGRVETEDVDDAVALANGEFLCRAANAHDALLAACREVLRRWTFDGNQQHTHSWHDMQDCAELIRAAIELAQGRAEGRGQ